MKSVCEQDVAPDGVVFHSDTVQGIAIKEDADYSGVRVNPIAFSIEFVNDSSKRLQWASFIRKSKLVNAPEALPDVISEIAGFLNPIAVAIETNTNFSAAWTAADRWIFM